MSCEGGSIPPSIPGAFHQVQTAVQLLYAQELFLATKSQPDNCHSEIHIVTTMY